MGFTLLTNIQLPFPLIFLSTLLTSVNRLEVGIFTTRKKQKLTRQAKKEEK